MRYPLFLTVLVLGLTDARPARAQFIVGSVCPPAFAGNFVVAGGFGFSYYRPGLRVVGFAGGFGTRSVFVTPVAPLFPVVPPIVPVLPPVAQWTPWGWTPGFLPAGWGVGPGWGWGVGPGWGWGVGPGWGWWNPAPRIVVPPILLADHSTGDADRGVVAAAGRMPRRTPDPTPPGDFLVISPKRETPAIGTITPEVTRVAAIRPQRVVIPFDPFAPPRITAIDTPDPDPLKEAARLLQRGRAAFAAGEYGQAAEQFERAADADPKSATPHFLRAQALFAAGSYTEAVVAIRRGLERDPTWPTSSFDPKEPYGANPAAHAEQLAELRRVVAANPGEPTLEFLLAYQLWFIGEKAEARKWLTAAEKRLASPGPIALFK